MIAKKVTVNLFTGVKARLQASGNLDPFEQQTTALLKNVLQTSTMYSTSTIGACLEIAYHCQFNIDSQLVSEGMLFSTNVFKQILFFQLFTFNLSCFSSVSAAMGSNLRALGVLLLEDNISNDEVIWLQLAE